MRALKIKWLRGSAKGYVDILPLDLFEKQVTAKPLTHQVHGPHGAVYHARCTMTVAVRSALLDYNSFKSFNAREGMELGKTTLDFSTDRRDSIDAVKWDDVVLTGSEVTTIVGKVSAAEVLDGLAEKWRFRKSKTIRVRMGRFRHLLNKAYGAQCCISYCDVPAALQAAHLDSFAGHGADSASNGLLIRGDLHALFDADQLGIHPKTRRIYLSAEARSWPDYKKFHLRTLAQPQPGFAQAAPNAAALRRRWIRYLKASSEQ